MIQPKFNKSSDESTLIRAFPPEPRVSRVQKYDGESFPRNDVDNCRSLHDLSSENAQSFMVGAERYLGSTVPTREVTTCCMDDNYPAKQKVGEVTRQMYEWF